MLRGNIYHQRQTGDRMRINAHSHIFNLESVFTSETLEILLRRIKEYDIPDILSEKIVGLLSEVIAKAGDYTDAEQHLEKLIKDVSFTNRLADAGENLGVNLELEGEEWLEKAGGELVINLLAKLTRQLNPATQDARKHLTGIDILSYLIIALKPSIGAVTRRLMKDLDKEDAIIALMMDITSGNDSDQAQFAQQIRDTSEQVLKYPGRVFPFFAVNPKRTDHFSLMERALTSQGFVGVKLYPSLGFEIDSPEIIRVIDYCYERGIPILMHCSKGGFYGKEEYIQNSAPSHWQPILATRPGLKICFAHFGNDKVLPLTEASIPTESWTQQILELMQQGGNSGVYTDVAYHDEPMQGGEKEVHYFNNLKTLLNDPVYGNRILFGTDFWMVRTSLSEKSYWAYFQEKITADGHFEKLASTNPKEFLGIDQPGGNINIALQNYLHFIVERQHELNMRTAGSWLRTELSRKGLPDLAASTRALSRDWQTNNEAHRRTFLVLAANQMYPDDREQAKFIDCADFPVNQLQYWNKEFESIGIFQKKCEAVAKLLDSYFIANAASYETAVSHKLAISKLTAKLSDESSVFADLGKLADELYLFSWEQSSS